jgi:hypothetical protein
MSRIPRIEMIAHCSDFLLLIPMVWLGWRSLTGPQAGQS